MSGQGTVDTAKEIASFDSSKLKRVETKEAQSIPSPEGKLLHEYFSECYGFRFVTLPAPQLASPQQCVERFKHSHLNEKNIIAKLLTFAGYVHHYLVREYFWPHFEKQGGTTLIFRLAARTFVMPLAQKVL